MKQFILLLLTFNVFAQNPPPPATPLNPPIDPIGNESNSDNVLLGKTLYWDEQLSSTKTTSCGTCHILSAGGTDPRAIVNTSINPGFDGLFNTDDDVIGSLGVAETDAEGNYIQNEFYGYTTQVTNRKTPTSINAGYANNLFWDGRASDQLIDPMTNEVILPSGAALESQVLGPPLATSEMSHTGRTWNDVIQTIKESSPMALSGNVNEELRNWIASDSYFELFDKAFGNTEITPSKVAMAIASYERSLYSNQSPFDDSLNGNPAALTAQERRGLGVFRGALCGGCHSSALLSDNQFHNTGVTPNIEDEGRFIVTGLAPDRGRFKTPVLRNLENQTSFMHNGNFATLEEVVDFYDRGGDFNNPNLDPRMVPLNLSLNQKNDLVAFLKRPLTDQRVIQETGPFSRPSLYTESNRVPQITQTGIEGIENKIPVVIANQPPLLGNSSFTIAIENALPLANATFVMGLNDPGTSTLPLENDNIIYQTITLSGGSDGHGSLSLKLPSQQSMNGENLYGRWYVSDEASVTGYAISQLVEITLFKPNFGTAGQIFIESFE